MNLALARRLLAALLLLALAPGLTLARQSRSQLVEEAERSLDGIDWQSELVVEKQLRRLCSEPYELQRTHPRWLEHEAMQSWRLFRLPEGSVMHADGEEVLLDPGWGFAPAQGSRESTRPNERFEALRSYFASEAFRNALNDGGVEDHALSGGGRMLLLRLPDYAPCFARDARFENQSRMRCYATELMLELDEDGRLRTLELDHAYGGSSIPRPGNGWTTAADFEHVRPSLLMTYRMRFEVDEAHHSESALLVREVAHRGLAGLSSLQLEAVPQLALPDPLPPGQPRQLWDDALHALQRPQAPLLLRGEVRIELPEGVERAADELRTLNWFESSGRLDPAQLARGELDLLILPSGDYAFELIGVDGHVLGGEALYEWSAPHTSMETALVHADLRGFAHLDPALLRGHPSAVPGPRGRVSLGVQIAGAAFHAQPLRAWSELTRPTTALAQIDVDAAGQLTAIELRVVRHSIERSSPWMLEAEGLSSEREGTVLQSFTQVVRLRPVLDPPSPALMRCAQLAQALQGG